MALVHVKAWRLASVSCLTMRRAMSTGVGLNSTSTIQSENESTSPKKEKRPKPVKAALTVLKPSPSMVDMRVGRVLQVEKHPNADSLYVETIDVGEPEPRTICSGLVRYMTLDQISNQLVTVVCNLKPVTMRGVKSFGMLLCASAAEGSAPEVEFVRPPFTSEPGERIYLEGEPYDSEKPEPVLNPKKKIFETIQPGYRTLDSLEAAWIHPETRLVHKLRTKDGICRVDSLKNASLS